MEEKEGVKGRRIILPHITVRKLINIVVFVAWNIKSPYSKVNSVVWLLDGDDWRNCRLASILLVVPLRRRGIGEYRVVGSFKTVDVIVFFARRNPFLFVVLEFLEIQPANNILIEYLGHLVCFLVIQCRVVKSGSVRKFVTDQTRVWVSDCLISFWLGVFASFLVFYIHNAFWKLVGAERVWYRRAILEYVLFISEDTGNTLFFGLVGSLVPVWKSQVFTTRRSPQSVF
ncbi:hypothetical protein HG531_012113 [Fusarium graminearum]|nr:hypothetical protein HG531_012113 [Fusarium graminearum]